MTYSIHQATTIDNAQGNITPKYSHYDTLEDMLAFCNEKDFKSIVFSDNKGDIIDHNLLTGATTTLN